MNQIGIETTQHVKLYFNTAGIGDRLLAFLIDGVVMIAYSVVVSMIFNSVIGFNLLDQNYVNQNPWITVIVYGIPIFLYHFVMEISWNGKSVGKWLMGIQVVSTDGEPPTMGQYLIRWMFRLVEITFSFGLIAFIAVLSNGKGQRIGDRAAGTAVIKIRKGARLSDTIYSELEKGFNARYQEAELLTDKDITIIREVLSSKREYDESTWFVMIQRTANLIQKKLNIKKQEEEADQFLEQLVDDYNFLHNE